MRTILVTSFRLLLFVGFSTAPPKSSDVPLHSYLKMRSSVTQLCEVQSTQKEKTTLPTPFILPRCCFKRELNNF